MCSYLSFLIGSKRVFSSLAIGEVYFVFRSPEESEGGGGERVLPNEKEMGMMGLLGPHVLCWRWGRWWQDGYEQSWEVEKDPSSFPTKEEQKILDFRMPY